MSDGRPPVYCIRAVDGTRAAVGVILRDMHESLFGTSAPQIVPEEGHWWVAWKAGKPVGFAGLRMTSSTPRTAYLHRSGVIQRHRGHGLQVRFIRIREAKARELGMTRMVTDTTGNVPSSNSLIRAGYRLFTPFEPWAWEHSLYWEKNL